MVTFQFRARQKTGRRAERTKSREFTTKEGSHMDVPTFQEIILRLQEYWSRNECVIWQPYSEKVGAGTMNPATILKVLGPEGWNVGYVEPSYRPDDGRFAENPNRMQMHTQYQVILKPDPGNPQERYLGSLKAIGIDIEKHDIRFVEDNWASPALGAWGLGWEVWLDGLEITQFTYFQQAGGLNLDPVAVEITYGLERIAMFLQGVRDVWSLRWNNRLTYGDILKQQEIDHCRYAFQTATIKRLRAMYRLFEEEARTAVENGLVVPALDYLLRQSHTFNLLDTRGAVGVTERAGFFARMRNQARAIAELYVAQREAAGFPDRAEPRPVEAPAAEFPSGEEPERADFLLEMGTEELPPADVVAAARGLEEQARGLLEEARLPFDSIFSTGTPRRQVLVVKGVRAKQEDKTEELKGPPAKIAFDESGEPTKAALGFAKRQGISPEDLVRKEVNGTEYVFALKREEGRSAVEVLSELVPRLVASLKFPKTMRWDSDGVSYPRPIRNFVALWGDRVVPFVYAKAPSGRLSRALRHLAPPVTIPRAELYFETMARAGITVDRSERRKLVEKLAADQARKAGGRLEEDPALLDEVTDLVESPFAILGSFDSGHLELPSEVLVAVMKKHQRYFAVRDEEGNLLPHFVVVANGKPEDPDLVRRGNEDVIRARYADAAYFVREDRKKPLKSFVPALKKLTFQENLGSMWHKTQRLRRLVAELGPSVLARKRDLAVARRAAFLAKADLATSMVIEMTSLQGVMGMHYALESGEKPEVATAIAEHYRPRFQGDRLPETGPGVLLAIADRLDSLASLFQLGLAPTGSADPYGLRRNALGLVSILVEKEIDISLREALRTALQVLGRPIDEDRFRETFEFLVKRQEVKFREDGYRHDVVAAALAAQGDRPVRAARAVGELSELVEKPDWTESFTAWSRIKRIVRPLPERLPLTVEEDEEKETRELHRLFVETAGDGKPENLVAFKEILDRLRDQINRFFDIVLVMDKDERLRAARLSLLQRIAELPDHLADLTLLEGF